MKVRLLVLFKILSSKAFPIEKVSTELIVLEDDLVVSRSFFSYAKYAVDKYYNDMIDSKIDSKFIFELFKLLETVTYNDDKKEYYENFYNKI